MQSNIKAQMAAALFLVAAIDPSAASLAGNAQVSVQTTSASCDRGESRVRIAQQGRINPDNIAGARSADEPPRDREREHETLPSDGTRSLPAPAEPPPNEPTRPHEPNR
jgi:hypothetical protein